MSIASGDVANLLTALVNVSCHPETGPRILKLYQDQIKGFIADKPDLQTMEILYPLDQALKLAAAAQVPTVYVPSSLDINDYVSPKTELIGEVLQVEGQPEEILEPKEDIPF